ncbi:Neuroligin-3 [Branchiostoma belcheri]|nr:Neuroligin-3 [Branchiostoma belcheri]
MVFIHGGDFMHGAGSMYDGSVLASHGTVVVVTINYRIGILGYLSTTDNSAVGNFALMDQIAALRWVNDNIANFKGDPTRVTLFGPETGAVNINLLTLAPEAAGLFRRAILQGGSAIASWSLSPDPRRFSNLLAENVSCCRPNTTLGVECLRNVPWRDLLAVEISSPNPFKSTFGPIIDGDVVPDNPKTLMRGELFRSYDILMGVTEQDGYKYVEDFPGVDEGIDDEGFRLIIGDFVNQVYPYRENEIQDAVAFMYTNWGEENNRTRRDGVVRMFTEHQVAVPLIILGNLHSNENYETSTYFYTFNHRPSSSPYPAWVEAAHSEDLPFVLGAPLVGLRIYRDSNYTKSEIMLSAAIMTYWANFAKSGDPNWPIEQKTRFVHERPNRYEQVEWLSYRADNDSQNADGEGEGTGKKTSSWIPVKPDSETVQTTCMPFIAIPTRNPSASDMSWSGKDITWVRKKPGNSSELSIVIAVGTSLFFLNVVVFAVCYHRRNNKPIRYSDENAQERVRLKVTDVREVIKALELEDCSIGPNGDCQLETTELTECSSKCGTPSREHGQRCNSKDIGKARAVFIMLRKVWASRGIRRATKLRIFNSSGKSVLRYEQMLKRKWSWVGHTLRKANTSITQQALTWNPQGKRKRGRPKNSWRRDTEEEMRSISTSWQDLGKYTTDEYSVRTSSVAYALVGAKGPK